MSQRTVWHLVRAESASAGCLGVDTVRFWVFPRMETPQPVWVLTLLVEKWRRGKGQLMLYWRKKEEIVFLVFPFLPIASCPLTGHYLESDFIFFSYPTEYSYTRVRSLEKTLSLFLIRLNDPSSLNISSLHHLHGPSLTCCSKFLSVFYWRTGPRTSHVSVYQCWTEWE